MTPTQAALKTIVQCRPLWFWHLIGGAMCLVALIRPMTFPDARAGAVIGVLVVPLWIGVICASLWRDVLDKPASFLLPRHQLVWRRTLVTIALIVAAACTLVTLFAPAQTPEAVAVRAWQILFLSMAMFMGSVAVTTWVPNTSVMPGLVTVLFFNSLDDGIAANLNASAEHILLASPFLAAVVSAVVVTAAWRALAARGLMRRLSGEAFLPLHSMFNGARQAAYASERKSQRPLGPRMRAFERRVLARMRSLSDRATLRALWATLYVQVGRIAPARTGNLIALCLLFIVATVVMGFWAPRSEHNGLSVANLVLLIVCALNAEAVINPHTALLLNLSRGNRFRSLMFSAVARWIAVAGASAVLTAISITAGRYLDVVTLYGTVYTYTPMHPMVFLFFAPMMPFLFLSQVAFPKQQVLATIVIAIVAGISYVGGAHRVLDGSLSGLLLVQALSWIPFVAYVRNSCYSGDLKLDGT